MPRKFHCPQCDWTGHPAFELTDKGKMAAKCGAVTCGYMDPSLSPSDFNEGIASVDGIETVVSTKDAVDSVETFADRASRSRSTKQPSVSPISKARAPYRVVPQDDRPANMVDAIRERYLEIGAELARLEGCKTEHKALEKMLRAAGAWPIKQDIPEAAE